MNTCPIPSVDEELVELAHGAGGKASEQLLKKLVVPIFQNEILAQGHDAAVLSIQNQQIAFTTDSYVVDPIFFPGGDIGKLAVNGTVNDLTCSGAIPQAISCALIVEQGFPLASLERILQSMKREADLAQVHIVTGDTKVVPKGMCDKIFINTSGVGYIPNMRKIHASQIQEGDAIIISAPIAAHGICILSAREQLGFESCVESDSISMASMMQDVMDHVEVHVMRDATRGGVAATLNELASASGLEMHIQQDLLPIDNAVNTACQIMGIDPLQVANEGVMVVILPQHQVDVALARMKQYPAGLRATSVGYVSKANDYAHVVLHTPYHTSRHVEVAYGEQLPRIC